MNNVQATNRLMQIYQAEGEKMISGTEDAELMSAIDYALCALDQEDRTRIRETATEPPTREDADQYGYVLAKDCAKDEPWGKCYWTAVNACSRQYTKWTQLPEVTP